MNKHSPGPWRAGNVIQNDGSLAVLDADNVRVGLVDEVEKEQGDANLHVVIAAPELLEAAVAIGAALVRHPTAGTCRVCGRAAKHRPECALAQVHAAIAKARGE